MKQAQRFVERLAQAAGLRLTAMLELALREAARK